MDGEICPICCGTERETSLACPLECEYLREAHKREKPAPISERDLAYPDVRVTEDFVAAHEELLLFSIYSLLQGALRTENAFDADILAALEAIIQTRRTLQSGVIFETRAENRIAGSVQRLLAASLNDYDTAREQREGLSATSNATVIAILVFLLRIGQQNINGRPRGRMFIDLLRQMTPDRGVERSANEPAIIL